jgi:ATP adenylyltransferase/5',5'''-P-1,P-4-tetraphosphate phosphorylase II
LYALADKQTTETQLIFQTAVSRQKPHTLRSQETPCPFCDRSQLPPVLKEDGDILLVPNKYPILKDSRPLVLIETADCDSELSQYDEDRLLRVFRMGFEAWEDMMTDPTVQSVVFFKNHGPLSGGSLRHPHMQLIGLRDVDYRQNICRQDFYGPVVCRSPGTELNISDHPRIGFTEFNAVLTGAEGFRDFCLLIQKTVQYVLRYHQGGRIGSYNLFFYRLEGVTYCKIMPRYVTTPLFMGYSIPQVADDLEAIAEDFQKRFFSGS